MQAIKSQTTREEYLELDTTSFEKNEFYNGEIFAMSGGTFNHAAISTNTTTTLSNKLNNTSCRPMNSDMRITTSTGLDTYPDISVFCGEPQLTDNNCTLLNPALLIEVLSPSTHTYQILALPLHPNPTRLPAHRLRIDPCRTPPTSGHRRVADA